MISKLDFDEVKRIFLKINELRNAEGKKPLQGKQTVINSIFKELFEAQEWKSEVNIFDSSDNDLRIDFWKNNIGIEVAFNHRSFIGGDLLRLQAGAEIKNKISAGVYICGTKDFLKQVSKDCSSMVTFEKVKWYLENFYSVLTVPILLIGLRE